MSRRGLRGLEHPPRSEDSLALSSTKGMRALARAANAINALVRPRLRIKIPEHAHALPQNAKFSQLCFVLCHFVLTMMSLISKSAVLPTAPIQSIHNIVALEDCDNQLFTIGSELKHLHAHLP